MFQKFVLIIALTTQILDEFVRPLVDFVELIALHLCHTPSSVASYAVQTFVELRAQFIQLFTLRSKAEIAR